MPRFVLVDSFSAVSACWRVKRRNLPQENRLRRCRYGADADVDRTSRGTLAVGFRDRWLPTGRHWSFAAAIATSSTANRQPLLAEYRNCSIFGSELR